MMYKHLLIATDGSEVVQKAIDQGFALAKALDAKATVITVTEPWEAVAAEAALILPPTDYEDRVAASAAKILHEVNKTAGRIGMSCESLHVKGRYPVEGIVETAKEKGYDLIVMASHGRRGFSRLILGSTTNEVVTHGSIPGLVCR